MLVDLERVLLQIDGESPFKIAPNEEDVGKEDKERDMTIKDMCLYLLNQTDPDLSYVPDKEPGKEAERIGKEKDIKAALLKKIRESNGTVNLTSKESARIQNLAAIFIFDADRYGQVTDALEGAVNSPTPESAKSKTKKRTKNKEEDAEK